MVIVSSLTNRKSAQPLITDRLSHVLALRSQVYKNYNYYSLVVLYLLSFGVRNCFATEDILFFKYVKSRRYGIMYVISTVDELDRDFPPINLCDRFPLNCFHSSKYEDMTHLSNCLTGFVIS